MGSAYAGLDPSPGHRRRDGDCRARGAAVVARRAGLWRKRLRDFCLASWNAGRLSRVRRDQLGILQSSLLRRAALRARHRRGFRAAREQALLDRIAAYRLSPHRRLLGDAGALLKDLQWVTERNSAKCAASARAMKASNTGNSSVTPRWAISSSAHGSSY